jgi:hypothetical protein
MGNLTTLLLLLVSFCFASSIPAADAYADADAAYPYASASGGFCSASAPAAAPNHIGSSTRRRRIIDITHSLRPDLPAWESAHGVGSVLKLVASIPNGDLANQSELKIGVHTGTHVDAPSHIFQEYYEAGDHLDTLDLHVLNGTIVFEFVQKKRIRNFSLSIPISLISA